jgi:hypothetical protein
MALSEAIDVSSELRLKTLTILLNMFQSVRVRIQPRGACPFCEETGGPVEEERRADFRRNGARDR